MNLENIQKKLFERKLDTTEYFKTAFDVYREFLKNNKLLVFLTYLLMLAIIGTDFFNRYLIFKIVIHEDKSPKTVLMLTVFGILELIFSIIQSFLTGYYLKKIVMEIEDKKEFNFKKFILKILRLISIQYCLVLVFMVIVELLKMSSLGIISLILQITVIIIAIKYFLYFEAYYIHDNTGIISSIDYSHQLSKGNRLRKIIPGVILILISIIPVLVIAFGILQVFEMSFWLGIIVVAIFIVGAVFAGIYLQTLSSVIFLNVEYDFLKKREKNNEIEEGYYENKE
ncbi:hypothetical protein [Leptotrichia alba]|uniref:Uncharacterized protein n=1 Tax=Leptotrichia alba TaxID=3239304 RepID=A0AB39V0V8_9FUSO